ncbi:MAG TPA: class I SAM-dependent methyltransferase [Euzebyales bacterium]
MNALELRRLGQRLVQVADRAIADAGGHEEPHIGPAVAAAVAADDHRVVGEVLAVLDVLAHWTLRAGTSSPDDALPGLEGGFDALYDGTPPWDIGRPQPLLQRLADDGEITGRVLDVGCGTGEHTLLAAELGLDAVGVDIAPKAVAAARRKAAERGVDARFEVLDVAHLDALGQTFDTVIDCGLLHTLPEPAVPGFVDALATVMRPGGRYHLLCVSDRQPGHAGPRRTSREFIRTTFGDGWEILAIDEAELAVTIAAGTLRAWHAAIVRVDADAK